MKDKLKEKEAAVETGIEVVSDTNEEEGDPREDDVDAQ